MKLNIDIDVKKLKEIIENTVQTNEKYGAIFSIDVLGVHGDYQIQLVFRNHSCESEEDEIVTDYAGEILNGENCIRITVGV